MHKKTKVHDGIIGTTVAASVYLGYAIDPLWLMLPALVGVTMLQSAFTGFCPLYFTLDKLMGE